MKCIGCGVARTGLGILAQQQGGPDLGGGEEAEAELPPDAAEQAGQLEAQALAVVGTGDFKKAEALFLRAARLQPRSARLHEARAQCLLELEDRLRRSLRGCQTVDVAEPRMAGWAPDLRARAAELWAPAGRGREPRFCLLAGGPGRRRRAARGDGRGARQGARAAGEALGRAPRCARANARWRVAHAADPTVPGLRLLQPLWGAGPRTTSALWAAAVVLAAHIGSGCPPGRASWRGARVLELGAGTGLAGLAAAAAGASALLTDPQTGLPVMNTNVALNRAAVSGAGGSVQAVAYDWLDDPPAEVAQGHWDVVLAADLVYSFASVAPFVDALARLVRGGGPGAAGGAPALYAHNPRAEELDAELRDALRARGLGVRELPLPERLVPVGRMDLTALRRVVLWAVEAQPGAAADAGASKRQCR
ncbi:unnamed protein product [Prorocentrum cordatum]|uniref:Calmodulin-lysine N-methyltransferase n=1 Tax=Prorocentrum cordatum TaxID=2364126 RepID=A0ABN9TKP3_9DINO|nr:unnamed protein product [Polarella glacialis]